MRSSIRSHRRTSRSTPSATTSTRPRCGRASRQLRRARSQRHGKLQAGV